MGMSPTSTLVMGFLVTILFLLIIGAGFWEWLVGLILGPIVAFVAVGVSGGIKE